MTIADTSIPSLYVEGVSDVSVVNGLLLRHGVDTDHGRQLLNIKHKGNVDSVLDVIPEVILSSTDHPVGFVIDIDIQIADRWNAVAGKLRNVGLTHPGKCPALGYFGQIPDYPHPFGIWLMPDCVSDHGKIEHLIKSLIQDDDPLWPHSVQSVKQAAVLIDSANRGVDEAMHWERFREIDRIKSEIHTWLSWQRYPGAPLGAAIRHRILAHDSAMALNFLRWLGVLYSLPQLAVI